MTYRTYTATTAVARRRQTLSTTHAWAGRIEVLCARQCQGQGNRKLLSEEFPSPSDRAGPQRRLQIPQPATADTLQHSQSFPAHSHKSQARHLANSPADTSYSLH